MIIIKRAPENNGAHANQITDAKIMPPDEWIVIPPHLEAAALPLLPWVKLTIEDGVVTAVEDDIEAREAWEALPKPEEPLDNITALQLALAELAEIVIGGGA